jgi:alkylhydroperoxidase/carboxymuconolactone decarboxylase family protein YurZ
MMKAQTELRRLGGRMRADLFAGMDDHAALANPTGGFGDLMSELVYGSIWSRPGLTKQDRMVCTLAVICALQNLVQLRRHIGAALHLGVEPRAIVEILIQVGIYRGFTASKSTLEVAAQVFAERDVEIASGKERDDPLEVLTARGKQLQAMLHGSRKDSAHASPSNPIASSIYPLVVQYCYGEIWDRPGLDLRTRGLCAVAAFAALDHEPLLRKFALSALNIGASKTEVVEAVVQIGPYAGFAFMLKGLSAVNEAFSEVSHHHDREAPCPMKSR